MKAKNIFLCLLIGLLISTSITQAQWVQTNGPYGGVIQCFAVSGANLFAGTSSGVFLSTNNGTSWTAVNSGFSNTYVRSLAVLGTNLFAGTDGGGVWRRPLTEMITDVEDKQNNLPTNFALEQNYPNPFNPTTTIKYSISRQAVVSLSVYDLLGREVAILVNEDKSAGNYSIIFNGSNLTSGVYFYCLKAGNFVETKKLILLK